MSAYEQYSKPAYGAQGGDDSGGFFAGSQQGSQGGGGGGGGKDFKDESLRPVTIKQVLESEEAYSGGDFNIDGSPITQITLVGQVRSVNPQPTNITLVIDDGTGQTEVKQWINHEQAGAPQDNFEVNSHVRVWGRIRSFNGKRHVLARFIRPITDFNEVNYHLLESTYVHLFYTKGPLGGNGAPGGGGGGGGDGMFVDGAGDGAGGNAGQVPSKLSSCSAAAKKVFSFINNSPGGNEGINLNIISNGTSLSVRDVLAGSDELLGQGLIYPTVDDETWAILDY